MDIKELRVEMIRNNINQKEIAKVLNKTEQTICAYFDKKDMPLSDAKRLADEWNLSNERRAEIFLR